MLTEEEAEKIADEYNLQGLGKFCPAINGDCKNGDCVCYVPAHHTYWGYLFPDLHEDDGKDRWMAYRPYCSHPMVKKESP